MSTPTVAANDGVGLPEATGGDARQRILDATVQCFRAYGYEKSSMRLIANTAKVSQTLLHYHFETKEKKLFDAAINDVATKLFETAATQLMPTDSVGDNLADAAGLLYTLFIDNLDTVTFVVEFGGAPPTTTTFCAPHTSSSAIPNGASSPACSDPSPVRRRRIT